MDEVVMKPIKDEEIIEEKYEGECNYEFKK